MPHRSGGKVTGSHTTLCETAAEIVDFLNNLEQVTKISLGVITALAGTRHGCRRVVKIVNETRCTLLVVTQKGSVQDVRFYSSYPQPAKLALARFIRNRGWELRFGNHG